MTTENVTINLDYKVEIPESVRDDLKKLFGVKDGAALTSLPYANWPRAVQEVLFAGTEAQNEACCGEPEDCAWDDDAGRLNGFPDSIWAQQKLEPQPETCCVEGCDEPVLEPSEFFNYALADQRTFIKALIDNAPSEQVLQYVLEADQALEDAQIHIADQAEKAKLQAEEDEIVAEWRVAVLQASPVTASNIADWDMMAEDTKRMWRDRFYGNMEWLENFAKGDK